MSKIFSFVVVFTLSFSLFSAEKAPVLIGRMDLPSMMSVTEDVSRLAETVSPGSSFLLVMGLTALSFDPKMKDFDMSSNIGLYLYIFEKNNVPAVEWCAAFNKKEQGPLGKNDFGKNLFCKDFGDRAALADSKELLDKLTGLPPLPASASDDDEEPGITLNLKPELYMKNCGSDYLNLKNDFLSQLSLKYSKTGDAGLMRSKMTRVRIEYIEKILSQIAELNLRIRIKKDGIVFNMKLIPSADSQFKAFIEKQKGVKPVLPPFPKDKTFVVSGSFALTDSLRKSISDMFRDIAFEVAEDEKNNGYAEIVDTIVKSASGSFSLFMDIAKDKTWADAAMKFQSSKEGVKKLNDIFAKKYSSMKTDLNGFYRISELNFAENKTLKTLCWLNDSDILVYEGEAAPAVSQKVLEDGFKNTEAVGDEYSGSFFVLKSSAAPGERSDEVTAAFKDNSAALRIYLTAATVKGFIPPEYLSKKNKKSKDKKNSNPM